MHLDYSRQLVYSRRLQVLEKEFFCVTINRTTYPLRKKVAGLILIANYNPNISSLTDAHGCKSVRIGISATIFSAIAYSEKRHSPGAMSPSEYVPMA